MKAVFDVVPTFSFQCIMMSPFVSLQEWEKSTLGTSLLWLGTRWVGYSLEGYAVGAVPAEWTGKTVEVGR